jgi:hypothetical protein
LEHNEVRERLPAFNRKEVMIERKEDITNIPLASGERIVEKYPLIDSGIPFSKLRFILLLVCLIIPGIIYYLYAKRNFLKVAMVITDRRVVYCELRAWTFGQNYEMVSIEHDKLATADIEYGTYYTRQFLFSKKYFDNLRIQLNTKNLVILDRAFGQSDKSLDAMKWKIDNCRRALGQLSGRALEHELNL